MTNSINTNIAALSAQLNISTASNAAAKNVAQLSSGNRIIQASDDVTALAIGTSLGTQVSALQTAATKGADPAPRPGHQRRPLATHPVHAAAASAGRRLRPERSGYDGPR